MQPPSSLVQIYDSIEPGIPQLYHYTSQAGLLGMIEYKQLWFTHIHYMNDSSEYDYAMNLIHRVFSEDYGIHDTKAEMDYEMQSQYFGDVYSFSLSESKDQLSQWRGYCPNGGFCVSFDNSQLSNMMKAHSFYIGKCIYEEEYQKQLIYQHIVGHTPEEYEKRFTVPLREPEGNTPEEIESQRSRIEIENRNYQSRLDRQIYEHKFDVFKNAMKYAPLLKHKTFKEEQEWRIVAISHERPDFRQGKSFIVPYLKMPLTENNEFVQLREIIVSPTPHIELAKKACEMLHSGATVIESKIPYRNW